VTIICGGQVAWAAGAELAPRLGLPEEPRLAAGLALVTGGAVLLTVASALGAWESSSRSAGSPRSATSHRLLPFDCDNLFIRQPDRGDDTWLGAVRLTDNLADGDRDRGDVIGVCAIVSTKSDAPSKTKHPLTSGHGHRRTSPEAARKQVELMGSDDHRVVFMATEAVLNRGAGKPRDHSNEQGPGRIDLSALSPEERQAIAKLLMRQWGCKAPIAFPIRRPRQRVTTSIQDRMNGNDMARLENAHLVGGVMYLDNAAARAVRHAVEVAIDRDHAIARDATLEAKHRLERTGRQLLKPGALLREMLRDDAPGRGVDPYIGHLVEPLLQLFRGCSDMAARLCPSPYRACTPSAGSRNAGQIRAASDCR
jgi:hypothetical protein